jgi:HEPN domain-containing protein
MTPERFDQDDPREWMNRAHSNLVRLKARVPGAYLEDFCFDAQQAAEKAIKAVFLLRRLDFPYIHDLAKLLSLLAGHGEQIPESVNEARRLTPYAWITRYPSASEQVTEKEYQQAVAIAEAVVHWAEGRLAASGGSA